MTEIDLTPITRLEYDIDAILNDHAVAEPITRIELILADIVAGNTTTVEPVTRIETYLAIISGADYPVPEPVTRIETFLAIIAGEDYEEPEAVTRLEGLLAEWVEKGSGIWKTVTGTLIHITDALASPMQKCEVTLEPVQDLHGQDAPYPAGGGKNKGYLSSDNVYGQRDCTVTYQNNGAVVTSTGNYGRMGFYFPVISGETYTVSTKCKRGDTAVYYIGLGNTDNWDTSYGLWITSSNVTTTLTQFTKTFTATADTLYVEVYPKDNGATFTIEDFQCELGSSATAFSPYENICPITGWTGCEVTRTGKNLLNYDDIADINSTASNTRKGVYFSKVGTFTVSGKNKIDRQVSCRVKTSDGTYGTATILASPTELHSVTYTLSKGDVLIVFDAVQTTVDTAKQTFIDAQIQLEVGESASAYEAYDGTTLSVTFPDSTGTVYGGTVDFVSGLLTVDRVIDTITKDSAWYGFTTGTGNSSAVVQLSNYQNAKYVDGSSSYNGAIASSGKELQNYWVNARQNETMSDMGFAYSSTGQLRFHRSDVSLITDLASFKANFPDTQVVYFLATPTEIQLTPQQISSLRGMNNIWSNSNGDLAVIAFGREVA